MTNSCCDSELIVAVRNADHAAFRQLFDRYAEKVFHYINGYIKHKQQSEDLTQEVFKKIWEKRAQLDENKSLSGLLFTICYHQVIDFIRSGATQINYAALPDDNLELAGTMAADQKLQYGQLESLYQQAINQLPPRRKEIYLLSRHNSLSNKEIAEKLNISVKTVESQMTATLHFIRNFFQKAGHFIILLLLSR